MDNLKNKIRNELLEKEDEKYKKFHSSLCPNNSEEIFIGIRIPVLRKYAKELLSKHEIEDILNNIEDYYYEEIMLEGMVIANSKLNINEKIEKTKVFVPKIINWAICDVFCGDFKFKTEDRKTVWNFINNYKNSKKEFEIRFLIVMMLSHFVIDDYIDEVLKIANEVYNEDYYVKMAIAWLISICYIKYKEKTEKFMKDCTLDDWTYNKAIQKAIESYRVSKEDKEKLKKMKRK